MPYTRMEIPLRSISTGDGNVICLLSFRLCRLYIEK